MYGIIITHCDLPAREPPGKLGNLLEGKTGGNRRLCNGIHHFNFLQCSTSCSLACTVCIVSYLLPLLTNHVQYNFRLDCSRLQSTYAYEYKSSVSHNSCAPYYYFWVVGRIRARGEKKILFLHSTRPETAVAGFVRFRSWSRTRRNQNQNHGLERQTTA
jgi:hypothetical protein